MPRRADVEPFAARLLRWFDAARRDLPWRRTRDPWAIWVSEIMLQQTRVEAVKAPYERFLARFPTPASFAVASDDELLVAWRGLGYYRRARLLRDGARAVVAAHGGAVPADAAALAELPGVGAYTLGAVASIAFGLREVAVDGNVERVVARHRGVRELVDAAPGRRAVRAQAEAWLEAARPGDFNQAMMELGATVCTPTSPRCDACPVAADCASCRAPACWSASTPTASPTSCASASAPGCCSAPWSRRSSTRSPAIASRCARTPRRPLASARCAGTRCATTRRGRRRRARSSGRRSATTARCARDPRRPFAIVAGFHTASAEAERGKAWV